jgi:hypothetical protein
MRKRWMFVAGMSGLLTAAIVWFWPVMPIWRAVVGADAQVLGFSRDNDIVYTAQGFDAKSAKAVPPRLCRWRAATGELLGAVDIPFTEKPTWIRTELSPDAKSLLIGGDSGIVQLGQIYFIHDAVTGARRAGPITQVGHLNPGCFSADGRWFQVYQGNMSNPIMGLDIVDTATGERIVKLRDQNDVKPYDLCFASDGSAAAIHWCQKTKDSKRHYVQIIRLPGGEELRRFDLPGELWQRVDKWVGNRLFAETNVPDGAPNKYFRRSYSFDMTREPIGDGTEEPLLNGYVNGTNGQTFWDDGPGWVAYLELASVVPTKWDEWYEWFGGKVGVNWKARSGLYVTVRFVDSSSGRLRYAVPKPLAFECIISSDGKRVASVDPNLGVEVWNADPSPRWPWAFTAAGFTVGLGLLVGRWQSRRPRPSRSKANGAEPICQVGNGV